LGFKLSCPLIDNAESIFRRLIHGTTNAIRSTAMASDDDGPSLPIRGRRRSNAISQPYSPVAVPSTSDSAGADVPDVTYFERTAEQHAEYRALITNQIAQFERGNSTAPQSRPQIFATQHTSPNLTYVPSRKMPDKKIPQPGPAKLTAHSGPDEWLQCALRNQHLPEHVMKRLCEMCKELLMEGNFTLISYQACS